jgi:hypothetical protein
MHFTVDVAGNEHTKEGVSKITECRSQISMALFGEVKVKLDIFQINL